MVNKAYNIGIVDADNLSVYQNAHFWDILDKKSYEWSGKHSLLFQVYM